MKKEKRKKARKLTLSKKGDIELDTLVYWLIALLVLIVLVVIIAILTGKGSDALNYIKNLFRFGR
jgi:uncharacterized protein (UPF0333 family)